MLVEVSTLRVQQCVLANVHTGWVFEILRALFQLQPMTLLQGTRLYLSHVTFQPKH